MDLQSFVQVGLMQLPIGLVGCALLTMIVLPLCVAAAALMRSAVMPAMFYFGTILAVAAYVMGGVPW